MRKVQRKHMLVFNSFGNQNARKKSASQSRAINHLFIDVPNIERYKQKDNKVWNRYPMDSVMQDTSQVISSSTVTLPLNRKDLNGRTGKSKPNQDGKTKNISHSLNDGRRALDHMDCQVKVLKNSASAPTLKNSKGKSAARCDEESEGKTDSTYFRIDKNAMYPTNFKPFPQRNSASKSKILFGNQLTSRKNEIR